MSKGAIATALAAAFLVVAGCATKVHPSASRAAGEGGEAVLAIVDVTVVPMTDDHTELPNRTVLVRGERIAAEGPSGSVRVPAGARVIDGRGRWLMPGLADMHVHLEYLENPDVLKLFVANGVTTVRGMDGRPFMLDWRRRTASRALVGPQIVTAGPIIDCVPPARDDNLAVADALAARAAVEAQAEAGYDFIKTYSNLSPEAYRAVLAEAGARGLRVSGHVPKGVTLDEAAAAQWSLEHLGDFADAVARDGARTPGWARRRLGAPFDARKAASLAAKLAAAKVWVVPTAVEPDRALGSGETVARWLAEPAMKDVPAQALAMWRAQIARFTSRMDSADFALNAQARGHRLALIKALHDAGVRLVVGTDTPNAFVVPGQSVHLELANFVAAGLTPGQALFAATAEPARMLGPLGGDAGVVAAGRRADLLLLSADPLADVGNAETRVGVVLAGRWLDEAELTRMRGDLARR